MSNTAIQVDHLSKQYRIGSLQQGGSKYKSLREELTKAVRAPIRRAGRLLRGEPYGAAELDETIWALKDVSFEVKHGEVLGIIGANGAGKTTLLKILSRITEPTGGRAVLHGRVGSLLEVGTGFHPELTGRENTYLNGAILGMTKTEIERKFDEIVDFSGVEKFIDTPVKHYSSGMRVRLAFSVAAHLDPEILLIDEVLAVGDAAFQKKCLGKMGEVAAQGRTVLFVSHQMSSVVKFCGRVLLLNNGSIEFDGDQQQGVRNYLNSSGSRSGQRMWADSGAAPHNGPIRFDFVRLLDATGEIVSEIANTDACDIEIGYKVLHHVQNLYVGIQLLTTTGVVVLDSHDQDTQNSFPDGRPVGQYVGRCRIPPLLLNQNSYAINLVAYIPRVEVLVLEEGVLYFDVIYTGGVGPNPVKPGVIRPALDWTVSYARIDRDYRAGSAK